MFEIKVYELGKVKLVIIVIGSKYIWLAWFQRWDYWDRDKLIISLAEESEHDPWPMTTGNTLGLSKSLPGLNRTHYRASWDPLS